MGLSSVALAFGCTSDSDCSTVNCTTRDQNATNAYDKAYDKKMVLIVILIILQLAIQVLQLANKIAVHVNSEEVDLLLI